MTLGKNPEKNTSQFNHL